MPLGGYGGKAATEAFVCSCRPILYMQKGPKLILHAALLVGVSPAGNYSVSKI